MTYIYIYMIKNPGVECFCCIVGNNGNRERLHLAGRWGWGAPKSLQMLTAAMELKDTYHVLGRMEQDAAVGLAQHGGVVVAVAGRYHLEVEFLEAPHCLL